MWATLSLSELRPADRASFSHRPAVSSLVQLALFILFNPTKSLGLFSDIYLVFSWSILIIHFITACSRSVPMVWTKAVPFLLKRLCPMSSSRNGDMTSLPHLGWIRPRIQWCWRPVSRQLVPIELFASGTWSMLDWFFLTNSLHLSPCSFSLITSRSSYIRVSPTW